MSNENTQEARGSSSIAVAVSVELTARVFQEITGEVVSGNIGEVSLNKQAISGLIGAKLNAELLNKAEKV